MTASAIEIESTQEIRTITDLHAELQKWLSIPPEDADLIDFVLAVVKSHEIPGDPLWAFIVDASGAGKTELLRSLRDRENVHFVSKLSDKALQSGYRDPKHPDKDPSLLLELDEKILIIKDMSSLLSMRFDTRKTVLADLRDAYDQECDPAYGSVGQKHYKARFSFIGAATLAIERIDTVEQELGERCIKFRGRSPDRREKVSKALAGLGLDDTMRSQVKAAIWGFLDSLPRPTGIVIPQLLREKLVTLADFTALARSHVTRDRQGILQYIPRGEIGTRLVKEFGKLLVSLACIRGKSAPDEQDFQTVERVGEDSLPPNRLLVIRALKEDTCLKMSEIERRTGLPHKTVWRVLDDLRVLGIVQTTDGENDEKGRDWFLAT